MPYLLVGGAERVILNILSGLDLEKYNVVIATTEPDKHPWRDKFAYYADRILFFGGVEKRNSGVLIRRSLVSLAKKYRTDVILMTNSWQGYQALPKIKARCPKVRVYDILHAQGTPEDNDCFLSVSMPYDKYITKRVVVSDFLKKYYCDKYDVSPQKVVVIHNNIEIGRQDIPPKPDHAIDAVLKKHKDKQIISYIGRLSIDKSALRLVDIAKQIKDRGLPTVLLVAGDGMLKKDMQEAADKHSLTHDTIEFVGFVDNTEYLMYKSKFSINVSNMEGMPMSIMESMNIGTPNIAYSVGGIPELIKNKKNGYLVDLGGSEEQNVQSFIDAIAIALQLSPKAYETMSHNARGTILDSFSSMVEEYDNLLSRG